MQAASMHVLQPHAHVRGSKAGGLAAGRPAAHRRHAPDTLPRPTSDMKVDLTAPMPRLPTTTRSAPCSFANATTDSATPAGGADGRQESPQGMACVQREVASDVADQGAHAGRGLPIERVARPVGVERLRPACLPAPPWPVGLEQLPGAPSPGSPDAPPAAGSTCRRTFRSSSRPSGSCSTTWRWVRGPQGGGLLVRAGLGSSRSRQAGLLSVQAVNQQSGSE